MRKFCILALLFCACSGGPAVPKEVLAPAKMGAVLYDVIRADEMTDFLRMSDTTYQHFAKRTALYDTVFQLHSVSKETFQKSMRYYQGRPDLLKQIFDDLQKKAHDTTTSGRQINVQ